MLKGLQAWYPGFCKRPTFHDEYLPAFNSANVQLVDTEGQGIEALTSNGFKVLGKEYEADVIVWGTGYGNPLTESLAGKADMNIIGKDGEDMEGLSKKMDLLTLHGCTSHNYPNLFLLSLAQAGVGVNQVQRIEAQAEHNANIVAEAQRKVGEGKKPIIEPTEEACKAWGDELASSAHLTSGVLSCLPGYFTLEGDAERIPKEALGKMARSGLYGQGYLAYASILDDWRAKGDLEGIQVDAV